MKKIFENKRIVITGACGTVGKELIRRLTANADYNFAEIIARTTMKVLCFPRARIPE